MTERFWSSSEEHPPLGALLMHLDGDLDSRESAAVTQHLKDCWECRIRCEKLSHGIHDFMEGRQEILLPSVPPPPAERQLTRRLLRQAAAGAVPASRFSSVLAPALALFTRPGLASWVAGSVSVALLVIFLVNSFLRTQGVSAAEFIDRAEAASAQQAVAPAGHILYQKVQLTRGGHFANREIIRGATKLGAHVVEKPEWAWGNLVNPEASHVPVNWSDPLSVETYARWRQEQVKAKDTISEANGLITLTTFAPNGEPVQSASLTVRQSDWHTVAKHIEFAGEAALDVTEVAYEIRETPVETLIRHVALPRPLPALPLRAPEICPADLDESEVTLREAFHAVGADTEEIPEITRDDREIQFRTLANTPSRRTELLTAVQGIPHLLPEVSLASSPVNRLDFSLANSGDRSRTGLTDSMHLVSTQPPLAKPLWDYLGGMDVANNYLEMVRDSYRRTLLEASALDRLSTRYSGNAWTALAPTLQVRVNQLAEDHIDRVQEISSQYLQQLSYVLDAMLSRQKIAGPSWTTERPNDSTLASCAIWQDAAPAILEDLRQLQTSFRRLFVVDVTDEPEQLSAEPLLREAAALRIKLAAETRLLCHPAPSTLITTPAPEDIAPAAHSLAIPARSMAVPATTTVIPSEARSLYPGWCCGARDLLFARHSSLATRFVLIGHSLQLTIPVSVSQTQSTNFSFD